MTGLPVNHVEETKRISDGIITLQKPSTAQFVCIAVSVKVHSSTHSRCIVCDTDVWKKILAFVRGEQRNTLLCFSIGMKPHAKIRCTRKTEIMLWIAQITDANHALECGSTMRIRAHVSYRKVNVITSATNNNSLKTNILYTGAVCAASMFNIHAITPIKCTVICERGQKQSHFDDMHLSRQNDYFMAVMGVPFVFSDRQRALTVRTDLAGSSPLILRKRKNTEIRLQMLKCHK